MRGPKPQPWTVEGFEVQQGLDRARRRVIVGLLVAPFLSGLWALAASQAHAMDAGKMDPARLWGAGTDLFDFIFNFLSVVVYLLGGTRGLHAVFGALVGLAFGVAASGYVQRRRIEARVGLEAIRDLDRARQQFQVAQLAAAKPELASALERTTSRPARSVPRVPRHPAVFLVWALVRFFPHAAIIVSVVFAWLALRM